MAEAFYSGSFYEGMEDANLSSARIVVPRVFQFLQPKSVLDIGCGQGLWLKAFMEQGVGEVLGYDGDYVDREKLSIPKENFVGVNLEEPLHLTKKFDLSVSLEVGEHLSDTASRTLVANLTDAAPVVLFSAAIPGQGGVHHINEQWPDYWEIRFKEKGYIPVDCLRRHVWDDKRVSFFYAQNILLYVKETELSKYPKLEEEIKTGHGHASALVHPHMYTYYESRWNKIAPLIWKIPLPLIKLGKLVLPYVVRMPLAQLFRYLISGSIAAAVYFGFLFALVEFGGVYYLAASSVALAGAVIISFSLHKFFTFRERTLSKTHMQFALYLGVVGMDFVINLSTLWLSVDVLGMPYLIGAFVATVIVAIVNFIAYRLLVFRRFGGVVH